MKSFATCVVLMGLLASGAIAATKGTRPLTYICDVEVTDLPVASTVPNGSIAVCLDTAAAYIDVNNVWEALIGGSGGAATDLTCSNCVALGSETTGNYALGDSEGGAATSGDSATGFFPSGTIETARLGSGTANSSTFLRGDQTWAISSATTVLSAVTSTVTINNTVTETSIFSYTIPANTVAATGGLRLTLLNEFFNQTGANRGFQIKVKLGGSTILDYAAGNNFGSNAIHRAIGLTLWINALGTTNSQITTLEARVPTITGVFGTLNTGSGAAMSNAVSYMLIHSGSTAHDTTSSLALEVSITLSTNSTNLEWVTYAGTLELVNP